MEEKNLKRITPFEVGIVLLIIILAGSLLSYGVTALKPYVLEYSVFLSYLVVPIVAIVVLFIYAFAFKRDFSIIPFGNKPNLKALPFAVLAGIGVLFALMIFNYIAVYIATAVNYQMQVTFPPLDNAWQWMLSIVVICIIPSIVEEILFRGLLLNSLKAYGDIGAVFLSAACFAFFHLNPAQSIYPFLYGIFLGFVVVKTGNIYYSMVMHFVNNLATIILTYFKTIARFDVFSWQNIGILIAIAISGFAIFYTCYAFICRFHGEKAIKKADFSIVGEKKNYKLGVLFTIGTFAVLFICVTIGEAVTL